MTILNFNNEQNEIKNQFSKLLNKLSLVISNSPLLKDLNIEFMIAGGAVRELLLDNVNHIKDIDIILSVQFKENNNYLKDEEKEVYSSFKSLKFPHLYKIAIKNIEKTINDYNLLPQNYKNDLLTTALDPYGIMVSTLIEKALKDDLQINEVFSRDKVTFENNYFFSNVISVLKGKFENYNIDIMLTDIDCTNFIYKKFDFNICKVGYYFSENNFNFLISKDFLDYYNNKIITLDPTLFTFQETQRCIENHLPRIIEKYPDYKEIKLLKDCRIEYLAILEKTLLDIKISKKDNHKRKIAKI